MMATDLPDFTISRTLDRLAFDLLLILRDTLSNPRIDLLRKDKDRDALAVRLLDLLSQPLYVRSLLWRDFRDPVGKRYPAGKTVAGRVVSIHDEAIDYLYGVLHRRLRLIQQLKEQPTNMHLLLQALCRFGPAGQGWGKATIQRSHGRSENLGDNPLLRRAAEALGQVRQQPRSDPSDRALLQRRRLEFGPLWLIVGDWAVEVPEELSLFELLSAVPTPLPSAFAQDADVQKRLRRVLEALNERYGLLRSCGLDPDSWLDDDEPSINVLKDIKALRQCAAGRRRDSPNLTAEHAYEACFNALKGEKQKFAGHAGFAPWLTTAAGSQVVHGKVLSLDELPDIADPERESDDFDWDEVKSYIARAPELAQDELMKYYFQLIYFGDQNLEEPEILAEIRRSIDNHPADKRRFGALPPDALAKALRKQAEQIIERILRRLTNRRPDTSFT